MILAVFEATILILSGCDECPAQNKCYTQADCQTKACPAEPESTESAEKAEKSVSAESVMCGAAIPLAGTVKSCSRKATGGSCSK